MKHCQNSIKVCMLLLCVLVFTACGTTSTGIVNTKSQAIVFMDTYNTQYDDTMSIMSNPDSTEAQKELGRQKKALLTKAWPLIKTYITVTDSGGTPTEQETKALTDLINQITAIALGGK